MKQKSNFIVDLTMDKKYQLIYIWAFILVLGIILILLYTPLGGNLYTATSGEQNKQNIAPGVNYQTQIGSLGNTASKNHSSNTYNAPYFSDAFRSGALTTNTNNQTFTNSNFGGSIGTSGSSNAGNNTRATGASAGSGALIAFSPISSQSNNATSGENFLFGSSITSTYSTSDNGIVQRAPHNEEDPHDPGGDPIGDPLPLGADLILVLIGVAYYGKRFWVKHTANK